MRPVKSLALLAATAALATLPRLARADVQHVVAPGHTLDAIAHRYHVSVKAIVEANHLKNGARLRVGETLTIPGVTATTSRNAKGKKEEKKPVTFAMRPKTPNVIHATRLATSESFTLRVSTHRGKQTGTVEKQAERLLRSAGGLEHPIEPRLLALLGVVSNHFGSRPIEVISGFRPYVSTQYTRHSNHNIGRAVDFRVVGVPNEVVRDFCRTLHNVGCGYYPNSTFVHMDARDSNAFWIDYSRPGEPPRYNSPNVEADEGTSDVGDEARVPPPADEDGEPEVESGPPGSTSSLAPSGTTTVTSGAAPAVGDTHAPASPVANTASAAPTTTAH